ncbi:hypothetical protein H0H81_007140 [Sphagnurus paluster]|uniref:MYND-type domain-containing protein n=1 Tax=Sphagnurus paluster TaxID=117069 RepID=A0A9P7GM73_9AGAR|nr:hypothetical protein H0H81_007140 [Sphagnurus paluster]
MKWREIVQKEPSRVVRTLRLMPGRSTKEGDTQADIYPALEVVKEVSMEGRNGTESETWISLVDAGLADALCKNVQEMVTFLNALPGMPRELLEKTKRESDQVYSIFYEPSDLTVQIIARHWKYSLTPDDTKMTAAMLNMFLQPDHPRHVAYVRSNGLDSSVSLLLSKILIGVGPTPTASKQKQAKALMAAFADHFVRLSGRAASAELDFLACIIGAAKHEQAEPEIAKAVLKSTPFWNAMFRLLKKSAKPSAEVHGHPVDPEVEKKHRFYVMSNIVGTTTNIIHDATFENPRECEPLFRIWANENLFGALDEVMEQLVGINGMTSAYASLLSRNAPEPVSVQIGRLTGVLDNVLKQGTPALRQLLRTQFPRWRTLSALIRHDMQRQFQAGPPQPFAPGKIPPPDSNIWDHGAWQCFCALQWSCIDLRTACGKRGCDKAATTIVCQCQVVRYCSEACQIKDSKEHNLVCGHMPLVETVNAQNKMGSALKSSPTEKEMKPATDVAGPDGLEDLD